MTFTLLGKDIGTFEGYDQVGDSILFFYKVSFNNPELTIYNGVGLEFDYLTGNLLMYKEDEIIEEFNILSFLNKYYS